MTDETTGARIIRKLGGNRAEIARILGWPVTKVRSIESTGRVQPPDYQHIIDRAAKAGIEISPYDYVANLKAVPPSEPHSEKEPEYEGN